MIDSAIVYFSDMSSLHKLVWVVGVLSLCWMLEYVVPLYKHTYRKWKHAAVNFTFLGFSFVINLLISFIIAGATSWTASAQFGLLNWVAMPVWADIVVTILILDLSAQYASHYMLHKIPFLFRFHMIHHSDTKCDATTATRHHPGDFLVRELIAIVVMVLAGAPLAYYIFYRMLTIFFGYTSHANFLFPRWLDTTLGLIVITPNMHKFHHHKEVHWTDSNYGNIFSFWDRIFGTLVVDDPTLVDFGLDVMDDSKDEDIVYQLKTPFNRSIKTLSDLKKEAE